VTCHLHSRLGQKSLYTDSCTGYMYLVSSREPLTAGWGGHPMSDCATQNNYGVAI